MAKTNNDIAREMKTTSRQVSKSRKRGYIITENGNRVKYTAPIAEYNSTKPSGIQRHKKGGTKVWNSGKGGKK